MEGFSRTDIQRIKLLDNSIFYVFGEILNGFREYFHSRLILWRHANCQSITLVIRHIRSFISVELQRLAKGRFLGIRGSKITIFLFAARVHFIEFTWAEGSDVCMYAYICIMFLYTMVSLFMSIFQTELCLYFKF